MPKQQNLQNDLTESITERPACSGLSAKEKRENDRCIKPVKKVSE